MPPRRTHAKSRNGCEQCKARHKKCDETGPPCTNCISRGSDCRYPNSAFQHYHWSGHSLKIGEAQEESITPLVQLRQLNPDSRMTELGLMHHWCLKSCYSFSPGMSDIFQNYAVQLGLRHEFLMNSLLAFTCFHKAAEGVKSNSNYVSIISDAFRYQDRTLPAFRAELEQISPSNCEALLLCSMIMMACAAISPSLDINNDSELERNSKTLHPSLTSIFFFAKGIHSVIDRTRPWLDESPLKPAIQLYPKEYWTTSPPEGNIIPFELKRICDNTSVETRETYKREVIMLENCSARDESMALAWVVEVGESFVSRIQEKEPVALLVYICWGALIGCSKYSWWARLAGQTVVKRLAFMISIKSEEEKVILNWAKEKIGTGKK